MCKTVNYLPCVLQPPIQLHSLTHVIDADRPWRCKHIHRKVTQTLNTAQSVNDLAISPIDPTILASVSIDHSLRLWSLHPSHEKQPLAAICYGQGHKDQILTLVCDFAKW